MSERHDHRRVGLCTPKCSICFRSESAARQILALRDQTAAPAAQPAVPAEAVSDRPSAPVSATAGALWAVDAEKELGKIPFFVRGKARRNTERFAADNAVALITVETLYDAKAHFSR